MTYSNTLPGLILGPTSPATLLLLQPLLHCLMLAHHVPTDVMTNFYFNACHILLDIIILKATMTIRCRITPTHLKKRSTMHRKIFASHRANWEPMQARMPKPHGLHEE